VIAYNLKLTIQFQIKYTGKMEQTRGFFSRKREITSKMEPHSTDELGD